MTEVADLKVKYGTLEGEVHNLGRDFNRFEQKTEAQFERMDKRAEEHAARFDDKLDKLLANISTGQPSQPGGPQTKTADTDWLKAGGLTLAGALFLGFMSYVNAVNTGNINDLKQISRDNAQAVAALNTDIRTVDSKQSAALARAVAERETQTTEAIAKATASAVPRPELDRDFSFVDQQLDRKVNLDLFNKAADYRNDQIKSLRDGLDTLRDQSASKAETQALNERMSTLSNRLNDLIGKLIAVPKDPRLN